MAAGAPPPTPRAPARSGLILRRDQRGGNPPTHLPAPAPPVDAGAAAPVGAAASSEPARDGAGGPGGADATLLGGTRPSAMARRAIATSSAAPRSAAEAPSAGAAGPGRAGGAETGVVTSATRGR